MNRMTKGMKGKGTEETKERVNAKSDRFENLVEE